MNQIVSYDEEWAKQAAAYAETEKLRGGSFLSIRGGKLSIKEGDDTIEMPGNQACVIVLDSIRENNFYTAAWNPDSDPVPPTCYAFGRSEEEMAPHETMRASEYFQPQHEQCQGCPQNEFGTADKGKGKACQNRRRLALIPAGFYTPRKGSRDFDLEIFNDLQSFESSDVVYIKVPPTSVKEWIKYGAQVGAKFSRPPWGVITRLYVEPHERFQQQVKFEMLDKVPDEFMQAVMARHDQAQSSIIQGYLPPEAREERTRPQGSLKGVR